MNQEKQIILIIEAKDGAKYQGNFVSKDSEKLILILSNVTKTFEGKEEKMDLCELKKEDIAKISMIDNTPKKEEIENVHEIPENKKTENSLDNVEKAYDKNKDFFDQLTPTLNRDMKKVAEKYNKKNADTFKLQGNEDDEEENNNNRSRGMNRGRGGRGRGRGYANDYRNNRGGYNRQNKFDKLAGNNMNNFNNQYNNYQNGNRGRGNMNNRGQRGNNYRGRGGRYYKNNYNNRGNAQFNNNNGFQNNYN